MPEALMGVRTGLAKFVLTRTTRPACRSRATTILLPGSPGLRGVEHALRDNPNYALCLDLGQLQPLRIFRIENNAYERFVDAEMARGLRLGDNKPTALSLNADWTRCFKGQYV